MNYFFLMKQVRIFEIYQVLVLGALALKPADYLAPFHCVLLRGRGDVGGPNCTDSTTTVGTALADTLPIASRDPARPGPPIATASSFLAALITKLDPNTSV